MFLKNHEFFLKTHGECFGKNNKLAVLSPPAELSPSHLLLPHAPPCIASPWHTSWHAAGTLQEITAPLSAWLRSKGRVPGAGEAAEQGNMDAVLVRRPTSAATGENSVQSS